MSREYPIHERPPPDGPPAAGKSGICLASCDDWTWIKHTVWWILHKLSQSHKYIQSMSITALLSFTCSEPAGNWCPEITASAQWGSLWHYSASSVERRLFFQSIWLLMSSENGGGGGGTHSALAKKKNWLAKAFLMAFSQVDRQHVKQQLVTRQYKAPLRLEDLIEKWNLSEWKCDERMKWDRLLFEGHTACCQQRG